MDKSEQLDKLASALSAFQGEVRDAPKSSKAHKHKYADLCQVLEIVRPLMAKHGLSLSQFPGAAESRVTVKSILMHSSGQWLSGVIEMQTENNHTGINAAQAVGLVITYARRYATAAILGITQTDDDGVQLGQLEPRAIENRAVPPILLQKTEIAPLAELRNLIVETKTTKETIEEEWLKPYNVKKIGELAPGVIQKHIEALKEQLLKKLELP
jgi:hypothetical protein